MTRTVRRWAKHCWGAPGATLVLLGAVGLAGCKKEQQVQAVPVDEYVKPDTPPTYAAPHGPAGAGVVRFTDVTQAAGIEFVHVTGASGNKWMPETIGGGGAFFDYDGDGWPDVLLINGTYWPNEQGDRPGPTSRLYRNRGVNGEAGTPSFEDVTAAAGLAELTFYGMGAAAADYDGDGDQDLYLTAVGRNHLLRNDDGRLVDVTDQAGVGWGTCNEPVSEWQWSTGVTWLDFDRDGNLDLFVANYVQWTPQTDVWSTRDGQAKAYATPEMYPGLSCVLFRNRGDGTFADVTKQAGVYNPEGKSMSVLADDFNDDGWPDLVVTNDTQPNFLYVNQRDGTFADQALFAGVAYDENGLTRAGMGVSVADPSNSGARAIVIGNFSGEPLSLYTQQTAGSFIDRAGSARLSKPTNLPLTFGVLFADFNLDGFEDLILANGHIEPEIELIRQDWQFAQVPQLFVNNRQGRFVEITDVAGDPFGQRIVVRSVAVADVDRDGDLDVLLTTNGGPPKLLRNDFVAPGDGLSPPVVRIRLTGDGANRDAIGARLQAHIGEMVQTRLVRTGGSYLSQSELIATFGLGRASMIDRLDIRWPDGTALTLDKLTAGMLYVIDQGRGIVANDALVPTR